VTLHSSSISTYNCSLSKRDWVLSDLQVYWKVYIFFSDLWLRSTLSWRQRWSQLQSVFRIPLIFLLYSDKNWIIVDFQTLAAVDTRALQQ